MAYVKYSNGVVLTWDETISVGEMITTYNEGYHILTSIDFRDRPARNPIYRSTVYDTYAIEWSHDSMQNTPLFHYTKVLTSKGTRSKSITSKCDASYCKRVTHAFATAQFDDEVLAASLKLNALRDFLPPI